MPTIPSMETRAFRVGRGRQEASANLSQGRGISTPSHKGEGKVVRHKGRKIAASNKTSIRAMCDGRMLSIPQEEHWRGSKSTLLRVRLSTPRLGASFKTGTWGAWMAQPLGAACLLLRS